MNNKTKPLLTEKQKNEARLMFEKKNMTFNEIAEHFNVSESFIANLCNSVIGRKPKATGLLGLLNK